MGTLITRKLDSNDIGQIIDGLRCRAENWSKTVDYLESGFTSRDDFVAEECNDAREARSIARRYERLIRELETQLQRPAEHHPRLKTQERTPQHGFCVFIDTVFQGTTISVHNGDDGPFVFATEREAQLEIVDFHMTRLQEFIHSERDYEDALEIEEYVMPVTVMANGIVIDKHGRQHGKVE